MKQYIKPLLHICSLTSEERFAVVSGGCTVTGCCPDWDIAGYEAATGLKVNYFSGVV